MLTVPATTNHLVLFFTRNLSLRAWSEVGMLEREVALYNCHAEKHTRVSFVTFGDVTDYTFQQDIPNIEILCNRWRLPTPLYCLLVPILHARALRRATIYKTNQLSGAWIAVLASKIWRRPVIIRCGYLLSEFGPKTNTGYPKLVRQVLNRITKWYEKTVFSSASDIIVASPTMREYVSKNHAVPTSRINVIRNHVLTDIFRPGITKPISNRFCFVGRFRQQKNVLALVEACSGIDLKLVLIGDGDGALRKMVLEKADLNDVDIDCLGNLPHVELPFQLCKSGIYVHATLYEGSPPKSLLEAMSCGLPVIASDIHGIRELIRHGENGWLCGTSPNEIREAIQTVMADRDLQLRMGRNARATIIENFSFEKALHQEMELLTKFPL